MGSKANPNEAGGESDAAVIRDMKNASKFVLLKTAQDIVAEKIERSAVLDRASEEGVAKLDIQDLKIGRVIGRGGFCVVEEVKSFGNGMSIGTRSQDSFSITRMVRNPFSSRRRHTSGGGSTAGIGSHGNGSDWMSNVSGHNPDESEEAIIETTNAFALRDSREKYVLKRLCVDHADKITFLKGVVDMAMEARFLGALKHVNVVQMYGVSVDGPFAEGFFLILERMKETLTKRIKKWMDIDRQCKGITGVFTGSKKKLKALRSERMLSAFEIAKGTSYLHDKGIIFRDLKPDNIGYSSDGVLKIFDFGLAKELRDDERNSDGTYRMTGMTGALRYMAPEVGLHEPYNLKADVYSWAMILWYMLALEPPFGLYTPSMIQERVFVKGYRPKVFVAWSSRVSAVMKQAWSSDHHARPSMKEVASIVRSELVDTNPRFAALMDTNNELGEIVE